MKRIIASLSDRFFLFRLKRKIRKIPSGGSVYFFDIDNTLADTNGKKSLTGVKAFPALVDKVHQAYKEHEIFFITSRNITRWFNTYRWLKKRKFQQLFSRLILVSRPHIKLTILDIAIRQGLVITYYDDLSYNHENGQVLLYDEIIREVRKLPVRYFGYDELKVFIGETN